MRYYSEITDEKTSIVYSCDMVRFKIDIRKDCAEKFSQRFSADTRTDVHIYPVSFVPFKYRQMITVNTEYGVVTMGIGFNGCAGSDDLLRGFVEFNPNKCFPEWRNEFIDICSWCVSVEPTRIDLAVDIPIDRTCCSLVKDIRLYEYQEKSSDDFTEYLGQRNKCGRVKLYNKAKEQKLAYPLTRLEITTECDMTEFVKHVPQVIISKECQIDFLHADMSDLSANDRVTVQLLNMFDLQVRKQWLRKYSYRFQKKIEKYVLAENRFEINYDCVRAIFRTINNYGNLCS